MSKIRCRCPSCNCKLSVGKKLVGTKIACPNCKNEVLLSPLEAVAQASPSSGSLPQFKVLSKGDGDSLFDEKRRADIFGEPTLKPDLPPSRPAEEPTVAVVNPFDFFSGADETVSDPPAKAKSRESASKSRVSFHMDNPLERAEFRGADGGEMTTELAAVPIVKPPGGSAETNALDVTFPDGTPAVKPKPPAPSAGFPIITWIFLGWALAATGAAIYFAVQKPSPTAPAKPGR